MQDNPVLKVLNVKTINIYLVVMHDFSELTVTFVFGGSC